jgi:eukaryotic-like serine/threonine-protein kinase
VPAVPPDKQPSIVDGVCDHASSLPTASLPGSVAPEPSSDAVSPARALRLDEIERSRVFFTVVLALTVGGIVSALASNGDDRARIVVTVASVVSGLSAVHALSVTLDPVRYHPRRLIVPGIPVVLGALAGVYYWGVISPVTGMLVYGIYFFSLGVDVHFATVNYLVIALSYGLLGAGIMTDIVADRGLVRMADLERIDQLSLLSIVEALYLTAFVTARLSQRATLRAVSRLEQAVRAVALRDAVLAEARAELDRVRDIGGAGKYSELTVGWYRLGALIGRGGIAEVYEARHVTTGKAAAVKLLRPDALGDQVQVQRLLREAQAASRIECRNVVRVFDVGKTIAGAPFIIMERMHGYDLAHELRSRRRIAPREMQRIVDDIAAGLDAAHRVGIVHRDLKPHNVFGATESGNLRVWKIVDFGVSKLGSTGTLTAGHVIGTPGYMSPEQARAEDVDRRTDVYALAAIVFRAVTGHAAFGGCDIATTLYGVVHRIPTQPSRLAALPRDLDRVLAIGLAKQKTDRFATALELAGWFAAAIGEALTAEQRARADELIARAPWGSSIAPCR